MEPHPQVWIRHVLQANDTLDYLDYFKRCPKPTLHDRMPFYLLTVILTDRYVVTQPVWMDVRIRRRNRLKQVKCIHEGMDITRRK